MPHDDAHIPGRAVQGGVVAGRSIRCPYHRGPTVSTAIWSRPALERALRDSTRAPSLYPVGVECWGGFIFFHLTPAEAQPLAEQLGGIPARIERYPLAELVIGHTITYDGRGQLEGHLRELQRVLSLRRRSSGALCRGPAFRDAGGAGLDWTRGVPHRDGAYTFTSSGTTARAPFPALNEDERERHKGEVIYPNLFFSLAAITSRRSSCGREGPERTDIVVTSCLRSSVRRLTSILRRGGVLGHRQPAGLGDLRDRATGHAQPPARSRLLRADGGFQPGHSPLRHRARSR